MRRDSRHDEGEGEEEQWLIIIDVAVGWPGDERQRSWERRYDRSGVKEEEEEEEEEEE